MYAVNDYGEPKAAQHRSGTRSIADESWRLIDRVGEQARGIEGQPQHWRWADVTY